MRILALAACGVALAVGGCGSDEEEGNPIPADTAGRLQQRLEVVEAQFEHGGGACNDILDETFPVIEQDLRSLPEDVDPDVRRALEDSFVRLRELIGSDCDEERGEETTPTETETTETVPTVPTETETTPTETEPTETDAEQAPGKRKEKKEKENEGGGQGGAGGQGGGAPAPGDG
jgi:hypothetical protein